MNARSSFAAVVALGAAAALCSTSLLAGGDKVAANNPVGDPPDDTYQEPYANQGDGRMLVYCEDGEVLVINPVDPGAAELVCEPAE
jgi:hypothetical protein